MGLGLPRVDLQVTGKIQESSSLSLSVVLYVPTTNRKETLSWEEGEM